MAEIYPRSVLEREDHKRRGLKTHWSENAAELFEEDISAGLDMYSTFKWKNFVYRMLFSVYGCLLGLCVHWAIFYVCIILFMDFY